MMQVGAGVVEDPFFPCRLLLARYTHTHATRIDGARGLHPHAQGRFFGLGFLLAPSSMENPGWRKL